MWRGLLAVLAAFVAMSGTAAMAEPSIDVGTFNLLPNTANQPISLFVTGGDSVTGFNFRAQIGDGIGPGVEPVITSVNNFGGGTIWDGHSITVEPGGAPSEIQDSVVLNSSTDSVSASGTLVNLTISTVGVSPGSYPFVLSLPQVNLPAAAFIGAHGAVIPASITDGTINVLPAPEPGTLSLIVLGSAGILLRRRRSA